MDVKILLRFGNKGRCGMKGELNCLKGRKAKPRNQTKGDCQERN
jgi:hypothetical protein